jgi:C-terminal processing protease CtpA/Prc
MEGSPAFDVGLNKDDILISINGDPAHKYKLEELMYFFYHNENDRLRIEVERDGVPMKFEFRLRRMF